ncbi:class E sortase [Geodermatophilus sabuli]|uniref:Class E sortase n=1 Tax=Geodermatophilus sabuli TaxID=1564158 RepID=A0A7K3W573_9ACTN|nr:class E sortase [Geodermatophilus sabuli]
MGRIVSGISQTIFTLCVVALLFVVYEVWVTDLFADQVQEDLSDDLRDDWSQPAQFAEPALGESFGFLHIPSFEDYEPRVVLEGTEPEELSDGPGHYVGSAWPGQPGNFALAGHRVGLGSPFQDLDLLEDGDAVVVETVDAWYVYRVTDNYVTTPADVRVVAPTPGGPLDGAPSGSFLTLTTCHPEYTARERLIVHATLESSVVKLDDPDGPDALREA